MKVNQVRIGEKFVLDDRGGVWEKTGIGQARCHFGSPSVFGTEIPVNENAFCFVFFPERGSHEPDPESKVKIIIYNDRSEDVIFEITDYNPQRLPFLLAADGLKVTPPGMNSSVRYHVVDHGYDVDTGTYYIMVLPENVPTKKEDDSTHPTDGEGE